MAEHLTLDSVRVLLEHGAPELAQRAFEIMKVLCSRASETDEDPEVADLVLRAAEHREKLGGARPMLDALLRERGLFPYLEGESLGARDGLAVEFHRPDGLDGVVFHRVQARIYDSLLQGRSVVLSAPTSFGKSLIIDAVIASGVYKNVLVIVPTLALIDETRRRLTERFSSQWKILTHQNQRRKNRNIYVLTAERIAEFSALPDVDFFVLDEFYKLSPKKDDERATTLNQVLYHLLKRRVPFYMLGPNIQDVPDELKARCDFIKTDYRTVASEIIRVSGKGHEIERLVDLAPTLKEPTLVFCRSRDRVRAVAEALIQSGATSPVSRRVLNEAAWAEINFHPQWSLPRALRAGIGVHHGRLPRALSQHQVRLFNDEEIRFLVCTSTLIEGINTKAKNVVVLDNTIARARYDYFTFNNIKGRAGRMFEHFIGRVYLFHDPPQLGLPMVDVPALTLGSSAPDALLLQADRDEVGPVGQKRLAKYFDQRDLSLEVLKANASVDPAAQLELAKELARRPEAYHRNLSWRGPYPTYDQVGALCELIWKYFGHRKASGAVRSAPQLTLKLNRLRTSGANLKALIDEEAQNTAFVKSADDAVENVLEFVRDWASYHFPLYAFAVDRIQKEVFGKLGTTTGDYTVFAAMAQNLFSDPVCVVLEEYGLPFPIAKKIEQQIAVRGDLDRSLERFRQLTVSSGDEFELEMIREAQQHV